MAYGVTAQICLQAQASRTRAGDGLHLSCPACSAGHTWHSWTLQGSAKMHRGVRAQLACSCSCFVETITILQVMQACKEGIRHHGACLIETSRESTCLVALPHVQFLRGITHGELCLGPVWQGSKNSMHDNFIVWSLQ